MLPYILSLPALSLSKGRRAGESCLLRKSWLQEESPAPKGESAG
jgi:hypothetical protein